MGRLEDARELLGAAEATLKQIPAEYEKCLNQQNISGGLKVDIKNLFENLRSVLDYIAMEIRVKYCGEPKGEKIYFPIAPNRSSFEGIIKKSFPGLENAAPKAWALLESLQPYNRRTSRWLAPFNKLNNDNKHSSLVPQERSEVPEVRVSSAGGAVAWNPDKVRFGPGVAVLGVQIDPRTQMPVPSKGITVQKIVWVDFRFESVPDRSAVALMQDSWSGVKGIYDELGSHL